MRGGGALTLSVFIVDLTSIGGAVSVGLGVILWVWVAGPSRLDVTIMVMEAVEVTGVSLTSTNHGRQSAVLLQVPDIHSKVMIYVGCSSDPSVYFVVCIFTIEKHL